jgi:outer membrane protein OmpA-like peptidoglycan-associated protein
MRKTQSWRLTPVLFAAVVLMTATISVAQVAGRPAQNQPQVNTVQVSAGQNMNVEGVIYTQQPDNITVRSSGGAIYKVTLANSTEVKERKSNPFRGAKKYSQTDLVTGLHIEVKGIGTDAGSIAAKEIRITQDDFKVAQTMDTRVVPVENRLAETQTRLGEAEQNSQRLSGQVQELSAVSNAARGGAKAAQETADTAMSTATDARSRADSAKAGVQAANERITSLDDYDVKNTATVHFKIGSAVITKEDIIELERLAGQAKGEKGYLIEVAGFASADGDQAYNRRLSQKRADAVIQYMAENHSIPLRRFVAPMGYGESQPAADNSTLPGRKENRRVEVRILVNKGLTQPEGARSSEVPVTNSAAVSK